MEVEVEIDVIAFVSNIETYDVHLIHVANAAPCGEMTWARDSCVSYFT